MDLSKKNILSSIEKIDIKNVKILNVNIFGDEVLFDIETNNPTLQSKKNIENKIKELLKKNFGPDLISKFNFVIKKEDAPKKTITGSDIPGIKNVLAIASGKGGVGKSTITSNIAVTLSNMGFKVGILDADIYGPSIPIMFDIADARPLSVNHEGKNKMKPVESYGIKILSIGFFTKPDQAVIWRGPMASKALNQMIFDAHWGELDFLLVDLPPGTGDIHLSILQSLPVTGLSLIHI